MATELELKLMVHSEYLKSAYTFLDKAGGFSASGESLSRRPTLTLMNGYFDTEEETLMKSGVALRVRSVNDEYIQTVKTRGSNRVGMHARGEWEWPLPSAALDLSLLKSVPLPEVLKDMSWSRNLIEVFRTDFERQVWLIEHLNTTMEVVCDRGLVTSQYGQDSICELELELKYGAECGLYLLAVELAKCVPVQVSIVSKAQKGARLKNRVIEFPDKPQNTASERELAAYWYEVWLTYWEAMFFMQDDVLIQPVRRSMAQLKGCLPSQLGQYLTQLDEVYDQILASDDEDCLSAFACEIQTGVAMLKIGQWFHIKHVNKH